MARSITVSRVDLLPKKCQNCDWINTKVEQIFYCISNNAYWIPLNGTIWKCLEKMTLAHKKGHNEGMCVSHYGSCILMCTSIVVNIHRFRLSNVISVPNDICDLYSVGQLIRHKAFHWKCVHRSNYVNQLPHRGGGGNAIVPLSPIEMALNKSIFQIFFVQISQKKNKTNSMQIPGQ